MFMFPVRLRRCYRVCGAPPFWPLNPWHLSHFYILVTEPLWIHFTLYVSSTVKSITLLRADWWPMLLGSSWLGLLWGVILSSSSLYLLLFLRDLTNALLFFCQNKEVAAPHGSGVVSVSEHLLTILSSSSVCLSVRPSIWLAACNC